MAESLLKLLVGLGFMAVNSIDKPWIIDPDVTNKQWGVGGKSLQYDDAFSLL